jgi:hypothetical protein
MLNKFEDVYPTLTSLLLMRLYQLETGRKEGVDPLRMIEWWSKKLEDPNVSDGWLDTRKWRQLARHIHAVIAVNFPCLADASGYDLGIETPLIPKPEIEIHPDGTVSEDWSLEEFGRSLPPFGFETWQHPLKCIPYSCDPDEFQDKG